LPQAICISRPFIKFRFKPVSPSPAAFPAARIAPGPYDPHATRAASRLLLISGPAGLPSAVSHVPAATITIIGLLRGNVNIRTALISFLRHTPLIFPAQMITFYTAEAASFSATGSLPRLDHPDDRRGMKNE
jgi:hypothetical protein